MFFVMFAQTLLTGDVMLCVCTVGANTSDRRSADKV